MTRAHMALDREAITDFCQRHPIRKLALFGSVLRDDFHTGSDVDILVYLDPDAHVTLLTLAGMELELTEIVGRQVDLRMPEEISHYIRQRVVDESETIYVRG